MDGSWFTPDPVPAPAAGAPAGCTLTLLGGFRLAVDGRAVVLPVTAQRIVVLVALRGGLGRGQAAGALWPRAPEARAAACLRTALWRIGAAAHGLVVVDGPTVRLGAQVQVDLRDLARSAERVLRAGGQVVDVCAVTDAEEELLPEWPDEWLVVHRERWRQLRLHALEAGAEELAAAGRCGLALEAALAALRADPLRESAHRALIQVHLAEGNLVEARRAYQACELVLRHELGVGPTARTARIVEHAFAAPPRHQAPPRPPLVARGRA
ncbi:AfsR/SARP family transcriptional regulator [Kineococcus indalonis]|uniref:AfsR/SARP family transcriptional regulator n=1 Tax=Kineococcus indalonis TaxID=2696566 RepID=UPI001412CBA2|nr:BTAD domain-containing putative transcriptional regulator [Kineococcus indalonis]NAZ86922.1 SARP family transcriptional regulator [Kineococcus indalonis]